MIETGSTLYESVALPLCYPGVGEYPACMTPDEPVAPEESNYLGDAVDRGWTEAVKVGPYRVLWYPNGDVRFAHRCDRESPGRGIVDCAPLLQIGGGHTIVTRTPLTISPSILCDDCGTHGFVQQGQWVPA